MELYPYFMKLVEMFSCLGAWQKRALAVWCSGILSAEHCQIPRVADALVCAAYPSVAALERRLGRFLENPRLSDELGPHISVMMVGLAYHQRAIPLLWRCYRPTGYPAEGQVALIVELLTRLRALVPDSIALTVQADRGIGTSPDLIQQLEAAGLMYLLRVQGQVRLRLVNGQVHALKSLVKPGEVW